MPRRQPRRPREERKAAEEARKKAEEAALAAAKSQALIELALMDTTGCNAEQKEAAAAVLAAARRPSRPPKPGRKWPLCWQRPRRPWKRP
ncbi:MAG: hypothetical protein ACLSHU_12145 [Oscillospiraceae bacterium]